LGECWACAAFTCLPFCCACSGALAGERHRRRRLTPSLHLRQATLMLGQRLSLSIRASAAANYCALLTCRVRSSLEQMLRASIACGALGGIPCSMTRRKGVGEHQRARRRVARRPQRRRLALCWRAGAKDDERLRGHVGVRLDARRRLRDAAALPRRIG